MVWTIWRGNSPSAWRCARYQPVLTMPTYRGRVRRQRKHQPGHILLLGFATSPSGQFNDSLANRLTSNLPLRQGLRRGMILTLKVRAAIWLEVDDKGNSTYCEEMSAASWTPLPIRAIVCFSASELAAWQPVTWVTIFLLRRAAHFNSNSSLASRISGTWRCDYVISITPAGSKIALYG